MELMQEAAYHWPGGTNKKILPNVEASFLLIMSALSTLLSFGTHPMSSIEMQPRGALEPPPFTFAASSCAMYVITARVDFARLFLGIAIL
jgi:hypothetical protein